MLKRQRGQAMALSLILMALALMVVIFSFNAAQLNLKGTKLQHTADNTAYSIATIAARDFNFKAYTNRAAVANQVAVAQMVGLSSWFNMTDKFAENACDALCWVPYLGQVLSGIESAVDGINEVAQPVFETLIYAENAILLALASSQQIIHYAGLATATTSAGDLVQANDANARLDLLQNPQMLDDVRNTWMVFQQRHSRSNNQNNHSGRNNGNQFQDFITVTLDSRDNFTQKRTYKISQFPWSFTIPLDIKWVTHKTGGSDLISNGNNQAETWTSMDTISFHLSKFRCSFSGCRWRGYSEVPLGWGGTRSDNRADMESVGNGSSWGDSRDINHDSAKYAGDDQQTRGGYSGVQAFYGLSNSAHKKNQTDNIAVVVSKPQSAIRTTSEVTLAEGRINPALDELMSGDRMTALSAAQAYYSRPRDLMQLTSSWARADGRHEYGNLYNPFWQTRLSDTTNTERMTVLAITGRL
jgi:hypothetical protein